MSITSIIVLSAIVAAFVVFAAVLAWGDYQTRDLARDLGRDKMPEPRRDSRPAAAAKKPVLVNS